MSSGYRDDQYAEACIEQVYTEIRKVWNRGKGDNYLDDIHTPDTTVETRFSPIPVTADEIELSMNREEFRLFAAASQTLTDYLQIEPTRVDYMGTDEDGYGQTRAEWKMTAEMSGVTLQFEGTGHHRWTPEDEGYQPRTVHNDIVWGLTDGHVSAGTLEKMRGVLDDCRYR